MSATIRAIRAREVLDSRGNPTVEVDVVTSTGALGRAMVPSGASTGAHEAVELRDGDPTRYGGKGVRRAVDHVHTILGPALGGMPVHDQRTIDAELIRLDGSANKSRLGANALLGVSLACAQASAATDGVPLWRRLDEGRARMPLPMVNLISGGLHAGKNLAFQDFLLMPIGARSYRESLEMTVAVYRALAETLRAAGHEGVLVGDEGGFGPKLASNAEVVERILDAFARAGLKPGVDAGIALDVASTHFFRDGTYDLEGRAWTSAELAGRLAEWASRYPILSIEDGMAEDDWAGWRHLTAQLGTRVQIVGDDLFVTNAARLARGVREGAANAVLVKANQIGTLTETLDVVAQARAAGYAAVVSARSGETEDAWLADLAVATGAGQIKIGSVVRSERLAKYNQLLRIEEQMGASAPFAGWRGRV